MPSKVVYKTTLTALDRDQNQSHQMMNMIALFFLAISVVKPEKITPFG